MEFDETPKFITHAISIRVSFMLNYSHPNHHLDKMSLGHTVQVKKNQSPDSKVNTFYYQFQNVHIWFSKMNRDTVLSAPSSLLSRCSSSSSWCSLKRELRRSSGGRKVHCTGELKEARVQLSFRSSFRKHQSRGAGKGWLW